MGARPTAAMSTNSGARRSTAVRMTPPPRHIRIGHVPFRHPDDQARSQKHQAADREGTSSFGAPPPSCAPGLVPQEPQ